MMMLYRIFHRITTAMLLLGIFFSSFLFFLFLRSLLLLNNNIENNFGSLSRAYTVRLTNVSTEVHVVILFRKTRYLYTWQEQKSGKRARGKVEEKFAVTRTSRGKGCDMMTRISSLSSAWPWLCWCCC